MGGNVPSGAYQSPGSALTVWPLTTVIVKSVWSLQLADKPQGTI
jgi:hypothetical protein